MNLEISRELFHKNVIIASNPIVAESIQLGDVIIFKRPI
jgi:hypothetical protein